MNNPCQTLPLAAFRLYQTGLKKALLSMVTPFRHSNIAPRFPLALFKGRQLQPRSQTRAAASSAHPRSLARPFQQVSSSCSFNLSRTQKSKGKQDASNPTGVRRFLEKLSRSVRLTIIQLAPGLDFVGAHGLSSRNTTTFTKQGNSL